VGESVSDRRPRIVVIGSANVDFVVTSMRLPRPGETVTGGHFFRSPGGKGANQAVAAARLGADVTFVARLGPDSVGDEALAGYDREGIRTDRIVRDAELPTGVAVILVDEAGNNLISVASGANDALSLADIDAAADRIRDADAILLQLEVPVETVTHAAILAAGAGVPVILDPAPAPDAPLAPELLHATTYLTPNESEASRLAGIEVVDEPTARAAAERLLAAGPHHVLLTRGPAGVLLAGPGGIVSLPAVPITAVDSTAAGDAFNASLACALALGKALPEAAAEASLAGALAATRPGAQTSLPTRDELQAFRHDRR